MLECRILGPFEVLDDGRPVALGGPKTRAVLAVLVLARGETVTSERLIDLLWGDDATATVSTALRVHVSSLRKALGSDVVVTRGGGYCLPREGYRLDADRFDELVATAREQLTDGDAGSAYATLDDALALWRGEPLAGLSLQAFASRDVLRLAAARLGAVEDMMEAGLESARHAELVPRLEALVAEHPSRERLAGQLMLALYRSGRQTEALEVYRRTRRALQDERGLDPGPDLVQLEAAILEHDPALGPPLRKIPIVVGGSRPRTLVALGGVLLLVTAVVASGVRLASGSTRLVASPNSLAVIDTHTDRVSGVVSVGARPGAVSIGAGGVWVVNRDDHSLSRIEPRTLQTERSIALGDLPTAVSATGDEVWVATTSSTRTDVTLNRVDPRYDTIAETVHVPNVVPGTDTALAAARDGLWVAPYSGYLTRLDPRSGATETSLDPNSSPAGLAVSAGAVWVSDGIAGTVTRVDRTGLLRAVRVGSSPAGLAVAGGSVWVAVTGDDAVVRLDEETGALLQRIEVGRAPLGVTTGDGSVWVANSGDGTVTRLGLNGHVRATVTVGGSPQALAVSGHRAWVSVDTPSVSASRPVRGATLRVESTIDVSSLDPALAYDGLAWQVLHATCAKLLDYPDQPGAQGDQLVPEVAQSLPAVSADGRTYTFTVRSGFRFSPPSGEAVTAETFRDAVERTLNPRMRSPFAPQFHDIVGADSYLSGKAAHLSGVNASGSTLTFRLAHRAPDFPTRITQMGFCAVPTDTPVDSAGVRLIPSAGPYRVTSYAPGQGIVLTPNPLYGGHRPRTWSRIEVVVGVPATRAVADVEAGRADYADQAVPVAEAPRLAASFGSPLTPGGQRFFLSALPQLDFFALNTHRGLFADTRLRKAVNLAMDRTALARLGDEYTPLPEHVTDHFLPPGIPGYSDVRSYPTSPDLKRARALARHPATKTAVLYTCDQSPCPEQAQIMKTDLAALGLQVVIKTYSPDVLYTKLATPGEPFDLAAVGWVADTVDPSSMLNTLLVSGEFLPTLNDPAYRARIVAADLLSGSARYLAYGKLDLELARDAPPFAAFGNTSDVDFFSTRVGCQVFGPYGMDLTALCVKPPR